MKKNEKRIVLYDYIRGIAVINMVLYHMFYDLKYIYGYNLNGFSISNAYPWQQFICWTFILIAGISLNYNSKKLKHATGLIIFSLLITIATRVFMGDFAIYFGIIHFLGFGILIISILDKILEKINPYLGLIINFSLFMIIRKEIFLKISLFSKMTTSLSEMGFLFFLGFTPEGFFSSDFFPIFPWIFLLFCGYYAGKIFKEKNMQRLNFIGSENILSIIGRNSIKIYVIHQPIILLLIEGYIRVNK